MAKVIPTPPVDKAVQNTGETAEMQPVDNPVETVDKAAAQQKRHRRRMRALWSFLVKTAALALVIYVLFFHVVGLTFMPNGDMSPRLDAGDLLLYYRLDKAPKAQDIVVFEKAVSAGENVRTLVCRVVACPGDKVEVTEEQGLIVNGNTQIENKIYSQTKPYEEGITEYPLTLGAGEYFVMADLRNGGMDSRYFGAVRDEEIKGIIITIVRRNNL